MTLISIYGCANDISVTYLSRLWRLIVFLKLCFYKKKGRTAAPSPPSPVLAKSSSVHFKHTVYLHAITAFMNLYFKVMDDVNAVLGQMRKFCHAVRSGEWKGIIGSFYL